MGEIIRFDRIKPRLEDGAYLDPGHWAQPDALYLMNEQAGAVVWDHSGNGLHGVASGGPVWSPDGIVFDGVDDLVIIPRIPSLVTAQAITMICRFKLIARPTESFSMLVSQFSLLTYLSVRSTGYTHCSIATNGGQKNLQGTVMISAGEWHESAVVYDGSSLNLYLDGIACATPLLYSGYLTVSTTAGWIIGSFNNTLYRTNGDMMHAAIYRYPLSADQVKSHYEAPYQMMVKDAEVTYSIPSLQAIANYYKQMRAT